MSPRTWLCLFTAALLIGGCSPDLNWREMRPEGSDLWIQFPCKPDRHHRAVRLAGQTVRMDLLVCDAQEATFALAFADLPDPALLSPALDELRSAAAKNLRAGPTTQKPFTVPGMTPNAGAVRMWLDGRRPDDSPVQEQAGFFVYGLRVYQATVLARRVQEADADTFFGALRVVP